MVNLFTVLLHGAQGEEYPRFENESSEFWVIKTARYADFAVTVKVGGRVLQIVPFFAGKGGLLPPPLRYFCVTCKSP